MGGFWKRDVVWWVAAAVAVGLNAVAGSFNVQRMRGTEQAVRENRDAHAALSDLLSEMKDAETGHRGYLLTGKKEFKEPYSLGRDNVAGRQGELRERWKDRPDQLERLDTADRLIRDKLAEMENSIALRETAGLQAAADRVALGEGKKFMDDLRSVVRAALDTEDRRQTDQVKVAGEQYRTAELTNLIGAVLAIAVLAVSGTLTRRELRRRTRLAVALAAEKVSTDRALGQLDALIRNAPYSIAFLDEDLRFLRVNDTFAQAHGAAVEEHFGRRLMDVVPDFAPHLLAAYQDMLDTGTPQVGRIMHGLGRVWEVSAFPVPLDDLRMGVGVIGKDVTERHHAAEKVREQASQLVQLTEGMPFLMWACRPTGECEYLSSQWVEYTGGGMGEQLGYGWLEAVHPDDRARTDSAWQAAVDGGNYFDIEYRLRRHDGEYRWFSVRGIPLRDHAGQIVKWYGSCADIDDRKRQEETLERLVTERTAALHQANAELVQQQAFVDAILDNVSEGIVACDAAGRLKLFNAATRQMHALPAEVLPADEWADHYSLFEADGETPMPMDRVPLVRAWRGEAVKDAEMVIRPTADDATERFVLCSGQPLRTPAGEPFGAVVSMRDMTQRREYERQLLRTTAALEASNDDLEKFAYIASHDLQEPLRKIQAFADRLATKFRDPLGEQGQDYLDRVIDSATRMRRLIEDLLAFSRVNTRSKPVEEVDLNDVVRGVLRDLEEQVRRTGGRVEVGSLPVLPADAGQLRQVFQNLIANALKFHRPDTPPVVSISAEPLPADAGWRIQVSDDGIGFEPQHTDRIFELFQRLHGRSKYDGTGLGLAIVKKIISRHGGTIHARGRPGAGATFTINWPTGQKD